jgi:DNA-binding CsgD family transcriptional regulator
MRLIFQRLQEFFKDRPTAAPSISPDAPDPTGWGMNAPVPRRSFVAQQALAGDLLAASSFEHVLAVVPVAAVLLDAGGGAFWRNGAAERLLAAGDGLSLVRGRLQAADPGEQRRLAQAIALAVALRADADVAVARPSGAPAYLVRLHRIWRTLAAPAAQAAAVIIAPRRSVALSADMVAAAFQLTPGEARVAAGLCAVGGGIRETATALGLSPNTVKTLLQRAFEKTGARSQAELAMLLATALGSIADDHG